MNESIGLAAALDLDASSDPAAADGSSWLGARALRRIFVVANPMAAGGAVGEQWSETSSMLHEVLGPFAWKMTERGGHATELTRKALDDGFDLIISMGGDGTLNETVNGFFRDGAPIRPESALAILPMGTGGDFKRTLGLSGDLREAAERIRTGQALPADVGHLSFVRHDDTPGERYFINIASCGIGGLVDKVVNESSKALGGKLSFMLGTLRAWNEFEPPALQLTIDDRAMARIKVVSVVIANGRYFGGGMKIAPNAQLDDGLFDVVIIRQMTTREIVPLAYRLYEGRIFESSAVSHIHARKLHAAPVNPREDVLLDIDGEQPGRLPATFTLLEGAVRVVR